MPDVSMVKSTKMLGGDYQTGNFGPFSTALAAEQCVMNLSSQPATVSAVIRTLPKGTSDAEQREAAYCSGRRAVG